MDAFAWVGKLMETLGSVIPRLVIVRSTHAGVKWRAGNRVKPMLPGLHIYWPVVTEVEIIVTARQSTNLPPQTLTTRDGVKLTVSAVVVHSISDVVRAIGRVNWDVGGTISDISQAAVVEVISKTDYQTLADGVAGEVEKRLTETARMRLQRYGVRVHRCALSDFAECRVIRLIQNQ